VTRVSVRVCASLGAGPGACQRGARGVRWHLRGNSGDALPLGAASWQRRLEGRACTETTGVQATVGDRLHVHARIVGQQDRDAEIIEVRGENGAPPYLVRFPDGHESLLYPGPDCVVEQAPAER